MDFVEFYNNQKEYSNYRSDSSLREEYEAATDWKTKQLCSLIQDTSQIDNILEVGCAFGVLLNKVSLKLNIKDAYGLDIAENNIDLARREYEHLSFIIGTIEEFQPQSYLSGNMKFDLVLLSDIIEHVEFDLEFLRKVKSISKYVLINLPLEKCYKTRKRKYGFTDPSGHLRSYNLRDGLSLITTAGLNIKEYRVSLAASDGRMRDYYSLQNRLRIDKKPFYKRIFWRIFYSIELSLVKYPKVYKFINGANLFVFCECD